MRPRDGYTILERDGVKIECFFTLGPGETRDYRALGLIFSSTAKKLSNIGVLRSAGRKHVRTKSGRSTYRVIWGRGCNYEHLEDYYKKIKQKDCVSSAVSSDPVFC